MKTQEIKQGDRFEAAVPGASYTVARVLRREPDVAVLVVFDLDRGTEVRYFDLDIDVSLVRR